jgi:hypothetical protein
MADRYVPPRVDNEDTASEASAASTYGGSETTTSRTSHKKYQPAFLTHIDALATAFAPSAGYKTAFEIAHSGLQRRTRRYDETHSLYKKRSCEPSARSAFSEVISDGFEWLKGLQHAHTKYKSSLPLSEQLEPIGKAMGMRGDERRLMLSERGRWRAGWLGWSLMRQRRGARAIQRQLPGSVEAGDYICMCRVDGAQPTCHSPSV